METIKKDIYSVYGSVVLDRIEVAEDDKFEDVLRKLKLFSKFNIKRVQEEGWLHSSFSAVAEEVGYENQDFTEKYNPEHHKICELFRYYFSFVG